MAIPGHDDAGRLMPIELSMIPTIAAPCDDEPDRPCRGHCEETKDVHGMKMKFE